MLFVVVFSLKESSCQDSVLFTLIAVGSSLVDVIVVSGKCVAVTLIVVGLLETKA